MRISALAILLCIAVPAFAQESLKHDFRDGKTAAPKVAFPAANADAPVAPPTVQEAAVAAEAPPTSKGNLLLLIGVFFMLVIPLILITAIVLLVRLGKPKADDSDIAIQNESKPKPASRSERIP